MGHAVPCANISAVYHPRRPGDSPLYRLVRDHFTRFELIYEERFQRGYGLFRPAVADVVAAYLKCGDLKEGFARVRCPVCRHEFLTDAPVIRAILEHLHLWRDIPQPRSPPICPEPPAPQDASHHRHEHVDDGWPGYEEPFISSN